MKEPIVSKKKRACIYARYSSSHQQEISVSAQVRSCEFYAQQKGYEIVATYADRAKSGRSTDRADFQKMMSEIDEDKWDCILVYRYDRFTRSNLDLQLEMANLKDHGKTLVSVCENYDDSAEGTMMVGIMGVINQMYIDKLAVDVLRGMKEVAYEGKSCGGTPPLGYVWKDRKYVIEETEAKSVRLIFEMYAEGAGYGEIIQRLNALGYQTKLGKHFSKTSIYEILKNERYTGVYIFNQTKKRNSRGKRNSHQEKPKEEQIRIEGVIPQIVPKALWDKVQVLRSVTHKGKCNSKHTYLLSGLVYCGCGAKMHGNCHSNGQGQFYYAYRCASNHNKHICSNKEIRADYLEEFVLNGLFEKLFSEDMVPIITSQINESIQQEAQSKNGEYIRYQESLKVLNKQKRNLMDALKQTGISKAIAEELSDIESQIEKCETLLQKEKEKVRKEPITEEEVRRNLEGFKAFARTQQDKNMQAFVRQYVERVTVTEDQVKVAFKAAFSFCGKEVPIDYKWSIAASVYHIKHLNESGLLHDFKQYATCSAYTA